VDDASFAAMFARGEGPSRLSDRQIVLLYALLCAATHLVVILLRAVPAWSTEDFIVGDTSTYIKSARNLVAVGEFSRESGPPYLWEPYRTPGYPLVLAASIRFFGDHRFALFFPVLTAAAGGAAAVYATRLWGGSRRAMHVAGLFFALLPNSLGYSTYLFVNAPFAHLFVAWLLLVYLMAKRPGWGVVLGASALMVALQLTRPSFSMAVAWVVLAGVMWARTRAAVAACVGVALLSFVTPRWLQAKTEAEHQVTNLHAIRGLREDLQGRYEARRQGRPLREVIEQAVSEDNAEAARSDGPGTYYTRLYWVRRGKFEPFAREHPWTIVGLVLEEAARQFFSPQELLSRAYGVGPDRPLRIAGGFLTVAMWAAAFAGAWRLFKARERAVLAYLGMCVAAFLLESGLVSSTAGRLRLPADMAIAPLVGIGIGRLRERRTTRDASSTDVAVS
jgi:hypothetical protein